MPPAPGHPPTARPRSSRRPATPPARSLRSPRASYVYTYSVKAPKDWDKTATHRVGIYGNRNLTEFDMGTYYDDETFTLVPAGGTPVARDVIRTESCNRATTSLPSTAARAAAWSSASCATRRNCRIPTAHGGLQGHDPQDSHRRCAAQRGGGRQVHHRHFGLVSGAFPSDVRRCETCHEPKTGAAQADAWLKNPSRAACGSCHDNIDFATGKNHFSLPQVSDNQCAECHIPKGENEFDASIRGAHTMPQEAPSRPGIVVNLVKVENGAAGKNPTVTFTLKDHAGGRFHIGHHDRDFHQPSQLRPSRSDHRLRQHNFGTT